MLGSPYPRVLVRRVHGRGGEKIGVASKQHLGGTRDLIRQQQNGADKGKERQGALCPGVQ